MKTIISYLVASLLVAASFQIKLQDHPDGNPIPICNGVNDGPCVTADDVTTPDKNAHGFRTEFEWETNRCSDC